MLVQRQEREQDLNQNIQKISSEKQLLHERVQELSRQMANLETEKSEMERSSARLEKDKSALKKTLDKVWILYICQHLASILFIKSCKKKKWWSLMNNKIVSSNSPFTCTIYYKHLFITITCLWFWYYKRLLHCFRLSEKSFVLRRSPVSRSWRKVTLTAPWTVWRTTTRISRNRSSNSRRSLLRRNNSMPRGRPQTLSSLST